MTVRVESFVLTYISRVLKSCGDVHAFDVLGDPVRRRLLQLLADGERPAGELAAVVRDEFGISQPAVSQHLRVLRENGFASVRPEGTRRLYAVDADPLREVDAWLDRSAASGRPRLAALETEIARGKRARRRQTTHRRRDQMIAGPQIDTGGQVDAVARARPWKRGDGTVDASVSLSQSYATDVEDLWEACSTADRLARWFAPVSGELELGGRFQVEGNAAGTIETCDPPNGFTATWEFGGADIGASRSASTAEGDDARAADHRPRRRRRPDALGPVRPGRRRRRLGPRAARPGDPHRDGHRQARGREDGVGRVRRRQGVHGRQQPAAGATPRRGRDARRSVARATAAGAGRPASMTRGRDPRGTVTAPARSARRSRGGSGRGTRARQARRGRRGPPPASTRARRPRPSPASTASRIAARRGSRSGGAAAAPPRAGGRWRRRAGRARPATPSTGGAPLWISPLVPAACAHVIRPGHRADGAAELGGEVGGRQRAGALGGLDDDRDARRARR